MEIKDYCDIHGEPIRIGDTVRFASAFNNLVTIGKVALIGVKNITLTDEHGAPRVYGITEGDTIEIISKYQKKESEPDMVNHPPHYQSENGIEVIDVIEAFTADLKGGEATNTGNVIKYMLRWPHKEKPLEDLKKARWYLNRLINLVEKRMKKENA